MQKAQCPSCGAEVTLVSKASVFVVCPYCSSTLLNENMDLRLLGKMAALKDDATVFQIGTEGGYNGKRFTIVGRVRQEWSAGFWNEWYIYFGGDSFGWLAEAQGFLMVSFLNEGKAPPRSQMHSGELVTLPTGRYEVTDIKNVESSYAEGELPAVAKQGDQFLSVDLIQGIDNFASIAYTKDDGQIYLGKYALFDDFKFKNLREVDGW